MTAPVQAGPRRRPVVGFPGFAAATIALVGLSGWAMTLGFKGVDDGRTIALSGIIASVLQIGAFPVVRRLAGQSPLIGWTVGSLIRFVSLTVYALLVVTVLELPAAPALISLFVFYFLSMLIEPFFLRS